MPRPAPSDAPSIIPGISAIIKSLSSPAWSTPRLGIFVVKGYGAIFGRAFVKKSSKLDFPAFGKPTRPMSAITESSTRKTLSCPGAPLFAMRGAWFVLDLKCTFPQPPFPPFKKTNWSSSLSTVKS